MSRERLLELRNLLKLDDWVILNEDDPGTDYGSLFFVESELVTWKITHSMRNLRITLEFHLFSDMSGPTGDLKDILYCDVKDLKRRLYFAKVASKEWKTNVVVFVDTLGLIEPTQDTILHP